MPGFSIIIAAHNEAAVIERTLRSILANPLNTPLQVIVVANGCTDDTAARARAVGSPIEVIETPIGNKIHALNLGDKAAHYFPRAFMDADVELSPGVLQGIANAFNDPTCRIVAPGCRHLYTGHNPLLAGYYHLWRSLPYVKRDMMARGFFAIDEQLRKRFEEFPSLVADDKFVRNLTTPNERRVVETGHTKVYMPATLNDLLRVKTQLDLWKSGIGRHPSRSEPERSGPARRRAEVPAPPPLALDQRPHVHLGLVDDQTRRTKKRWAQKQGGWDRADSSRSAEHRAA